MNYPYRRVYTGLDLEDKYRVQDLALNSVVEGMGIYYARKNEWLGFHLYGPTGNHIGAYAHLDYCEELARAWADSAWEKARVKGMRQTIPGSLTVHWHERLVNDHPCHWSDAEVGVSLMLHEVVNDCAIWSMGALFNPDSDPHHIYWGWDSRKRYCASLNGEFVIRTRAIKQARDFCRELLH